MFYVSNSNDSRKLLIADFRFEFDRPMIPDSYSITKYVCYDPHLNQFQITHKLLYVFLM